jgi:hypothetical protein
MPESDIITEQTGAVSTRTRWVAVELTREGNDMRLSVPVVDIVQLPDGTKVRQPRASVTCSVDALPKNDADLIAWLDLTDRIAKRLIRKDLVPKP